MLRRLQPALKFRAGPRVRIAGGDFYPVVLEVELKHKLIVSGDAVVLQDKGLRVRPVATDGHKAADIVEPETVEAVQPDGHCDCGAAADLNVAGRLGRAVGEVKGDTFQPDEIRLEDVGLAGDGPGDVR
jgi:hypothetical protein